MKAKSEKKHKTISAQLEKSINFYYLRSRSSSIHLYESLRAIDHTQLSPIQARRLLELFDELTDIDSLYPVPTKESKWRHIKKDSLAFLMMLAGKENPNPVFNLAKPDGAPLSEEKKIQIKAFIPETDFKLGFKSIELESSCAGRQIGYSPEGTKYYKDMEVPEELGVFIQESPLTKPVSKKRDLSSPHRILFETVDPEGLKTIGPLSSDESSRVEAFEFTVTKAVILSRINAKRPCSQKKIFGNVPAIANLLEIGMLLVEYQNGRDYHYAHRQAFSFGGLQALLNLDPMTRGANFATLFKVEEPIRRILFEGSEKCDPVDEVLVKGAAIYAKEKNVLHKVIYTLYWGEDHQHQLRVFIDPLSDRVPRFKENLFVKKLWALIMNMEFPASLEDYSESTAPEEKEELPSLEPITEASEILPYPEQEEFSPVMHFNTELSDFSELKKETQYLITSQQCKVAAKGFDEFLFTGDDLCKPEAEGFIGSSQKITELLQASSPSPRVATQEDLFETRGAGSPEKRSIMFSPAAKMQAEERVSSFVSSTLFSTTPKPKRGKFDWAYQLEAEFDVTPS